jgi:phosphatidylglycerol---prolipoprotein diacylglyceryl transferase
MTFPVNLHIGEFVIHPHLLFEELGCILGFRYYLFLRKRQTDLISTVHRIWILCGAALGALLLSRLLGDLENPAAFFGSHTPFSYYYSNKTIIGGLLGGLLGAEFVKKIIKVHSSSGDLFTFPLILAICIGRIGCFLAGVEDQTSGTATTLPWGMDMGDGIKRHPTALYEILFLIAVWVILYRIKSMRTLKNGHLFKLFMVAYLGFRFFSEFIKNDPFFPFGLSVLQLACIAGIIYYYKIFIYSSFLSRQNATLENTAPEIT